MNDLKSFLIGAVLGWSVAGFFWGWYYRYTKLLRTREEYIKAHEGE